ncbi:hypothetical protein CDAR_117801 [Caerostris darwini]|uniref:Uncharacterized protein n=1 Tax=Caerostris darwini TaxID=1538125 RepID=A0AAV4PX57_9ARAC|nr:hypothetical protein CDAR_117801 [Caerostris darwini]
MSKHLSSVSRSGMPRSSERERNESPFSDSDVTWIRTSQKRTSPRPKCPRGSHSIRTVVTILHPHALTPIESCNDTLDVPSRETHFLRRIGCHSYI